jgi:hypothetical protein
VFPVTSPLSRPGLAVLDVDLILADVAELRNIEMLVNARSAVETLNDEEKDVLAKISEILYSTDVSPPCRVAARFQHS